MVPPLSVRRRLPSGCVDGLYSESTQPSSATAPTGNGRSLRAGCRGSHRASASRVSALSGFHPYRGHRWPPRPLKNAVHRRERPSTTNASNELITTRRHRRTGDSLYACPLVASLRNRVAVLSSTGKEPTATTSGRIRTSPRRPRSPASGRGPAWCSPTASLNSLPKASSRTTCSYSVTRLQIERSAFTA